MKEFVVKETQNYTTWRIYKRIHKVNGKVCRYTIVNLSVSHDRKRFYFSKITPGTIHRGDFQNYFFRINNKGTLISYSVGGERIKIDTHVKLKHLSLNLIRKKHFSKYTMRKINRILKQVFPKLKVKDNTEQFLISYLYNNSPVYEQFKDAVFLEEYTNIREDIAKSKDIKELCYRATKLKGKKLVKFVAQEKGAISVLSQLKKIKKHLNHGFVNNLLDSNQFRLYIPAQLSTVLKFRPKWLNDLINLEKGRLINDICYQMSQIKEHKYTEEDFRGPLESVHDHISKILLKETHKNHELEEHFKPMKRDDITISLPKDTHEIISWGKLMGHCIGGYTDRHRYGTELVGAVCRNGEMIANFSMTPETKYITEDFNGEINYSGIEKKYRIRQLLGKRNQYLSPELFLKIIDMMESHDILVKQDYSQIWGYPNELKEVTTAHV